MSHAKKPRLLMTVYDKIEFNGRALRAVESLAAHYELAVVSLRSPNAGLPDGFRSIQVSQPRARWLKYPGRIWFWLRMVLAAIVFRPSAVYAHNFLLCLPGWLAARAASARFIYDAHELNIPGSEDRSSLRTSLFYWFERLTIHRADLVIAANAERAALMQEHYGLSHLPLVIRNTIPEPHDDQGLMDDLLRRYPRLRRNGRVRFVYQGNMSTSRGIDAFVQAVQEISDRCELLLVGDGPDYPALQRMAAESSRPDAFILLGRIPQSDLLAVTTTADVGIVTYPSKGLNNIYCASTKVHEYTQAGVPILTTDQPALRAAAEEYGIGLACDIRAANPAAIASTMLRLAQDLTRYRRNLPRFCRNHRWADDAARLTAAVAAIACPAPQSLRKAA